MSKLAPAKTGANRIAAISFLNCLFFSFFTSSVQKKQCFCVASIFRYPLRCFQSDPCVLNEYYIKSTWMNSCTFELFVVAQFALHYSLPSSLRWHRVKCIWDKNKNLTFLSCVGRIAEPNMPVMNTKPHVGNAIGEMREAVLRWEWGSSKIVSCCCEQVVNTIAERWLMLLSAVCETQHSRGHPLWTSRLPVAGFLTPQLTQPPNLDETDPNSLGSCMSTTRTILSRRVSYIFTLNFHWTFSSFSGFCWSCWQTQFKISCPLIVALRKRYPDQKLRLSHLNRGHLLSVPREKYSQNECTNWASTSNGVCSCEAGQCVTHISMSVRAKPTAINVTRPFEVQSEGVVFITPNRERNDGFLFMSRIQFESHAGFWDACYITKWPMLQLIDKAIKRVQTSQWMNPSTQLAAAITQLAHHLSVTGK